MQLAQGATHTFRRAAVTPRASPSGSSQVSQEDTWRASAIKHDAPHPMRPVRCPPRAHAMRHLQARLLPGRTARSLWKIRRAQRAPSELSSAAAAGPEVIYAEKKYKEALPVAAEACAEDTKGQTCYICTEALHWKTKEGLVRMCACRGTAGFAHVSCLAEQAKILFAEAEENNLGVRRRLK